MFRRSFVSATALCAAVSIAVSAAVAAPRLFHDLTGKWNVSIATPDQARSSLITMTQKGDSLWGTIESDLGSSQLRGVAKGDSVYFGFQLDAGGQAIVINAAGTMKDKDNMNGLLDVAGMGAFPFSAVRQQ